MIQAKVPDPCGSGSATPLNIYKYKNYYVSFLPITAVGWKASERKCERGNQYQYWVNTSMPTTPSMLVCPVL